jgi:hypothetical protein
MADTPRGRPPKLQPDEKTLVLVKGLGNIQATGPECAAVLGVTEPTWIKFKKGFPEVEAALRDGQGEGRASLRRRQFKAANDGNPTMLIWLGKQYLGQADKQEVSGKNGGPIQSVDLSKLKADELDHLERILRTLAGSGNDDASDRGGESETQG